METNFLQNSQMQPSPENSLLEEYNRNAESQGVHKIPVGVVYKTLGESKVLKCS